MSRLLQILTGVSVGIITLLMVWAGAEAAQGAADAVKVCLNVMIPSLYAFTVLSKLIISTGTYKLIGKPFSLISRYVFRMDEEFFPIFLISQVAGYPIGAALISRMTENEAITKEEGSRLLCMCIAPGPAFIAAVCRAAAPGNTDMWLAVFLSVTGANMIAALATAPFRSIPAPKREKIQLSFSSQQLIEAVSSGAASMTVICGVVILMSALMGIAGKIGLLTVMCSVLSSLTAAAAVEVKPFIKAFFEISGLTSVTGDGTVTIPIAAAMLSFGGVSVLIQIKALCGKMSMLPVLISRVFNCAVSYLICRLAVPKYYSVEVIAVSAPVMQNELYVKENYSPILSIFLLIMTILILSQKTMAKNKKM